MLNNLRYLKNRWNPFTSLGYGIFCIASTLLWSGSIPSAVILWPKKIISDWLNWHFDIFNFSPCLRADSKTLIVRCCNSSGFSLKIIILPRLFSAPSIFFYDLCYPLLTHVAYWMNSIRLRRNRYLPVGELNVSSSELFSWIGNCQ